MNKARFKYIVKFNMSKMDLFAWALSQSFISRNEKINHPDHYGGKDNPYETIKVIDAWNLNFNLGCIIKYVSRAGKKEGTDTLEDLKKAAWYLNHEIEIREFKEK